MAISIGKLPGSSPAPGEHRVGLDAAECEAFERLYREFVPRVAGYVRRHIHDYELVDEIVQETLLRAYRHGLHREAGDEHWRWLSTVARNLCIDQRALHRNWRECTVEEPETLDLTVYESDPEAHVVAAERQEIVARALERLSERERRLLVQKHVEGRRVREMANLEGMHVEALKSALRRARRSFHESYAAITDKTGVASVFGPIAAAAALRLRELKARIAAMGDQVTTLAAHVTTSSGFLHTATTAAVVAGLALGPGLGALGADRSGDGAEDTRAPTEMSLNRAGHGPGAALAVATRSATSDLGGGVPPSRVGGQPGWGVASGGGGSGAGSEGGATNPPGDSSSDPRIELPPASNAEPQPVDVGEDDVEEPEDARFKDFAYASRSNSSASSESSETSDSANEEGKPGERDGESEPEPTRDDESHSDSETLDDQEDQGKPDQVGGSYPEVFALGEPIPEKRGDCRLQCTVLFHSTDGGANWEKLPAKGLEADGLLVAPSFPDDLRIYAYGRFGLLESTDGGHQFWPVPAFAGHPVTNATFWPGFGRDRTEDRIVVAAGRQLFIYSVTTGVVRPLSISPNRTDFVAMVPVSHAAGGPGVMALVAEPPLDEDYRLLFCDESTCEKRAMLSRFGFRAEMLVVERETESRILAHTYYGLRHIEDGGRSYDATQHTGLRSLTQDGDRLYAVSGNYPAAIEVSDDGGRTWSQVGTGPSRGTVMVGLPGGRLVAANTPDLMYRGLSCSPDGGRSWSPRCPLVEAGP